MTNHQDLRYRQRWAAVPEDESPRTEHLHWTDRRLLWVLRAAKGWTDRRRLRELLEATTPQAGWPGGRIREIVDRLSDRGLVKQDHRGRMHARGKASLGQQKNGRWLEGVEDG